MELCKAGDRPAGRRLTCSDARVGYRRSEFRPGLIPLLRRASAQSWPPSVAREFPTVGLSPALHNICLRSGGILLNQYRRIGVPEGYPFAALSGIGSTSRAIAHRNAAISRASAVTATVLRLPFAIRRR